MLNRKFLANSTYPLKQFAVAVPWLCHVQIDILLKIGDENYSAVT